MKKYNFTKRNKTLTTKMLTLHISLFWFCHNTACLHDGDLPMHSDSFEHQLNIVIIMKILDPLRAKKTFIRKKLGHTMVSAI